MSAAGKLVQPGLILPSERPFKTHDPVLASRLCREWQGTTVVNIRVQACVHFIGRPSPLGNPFPITRIRCRDTALAAYREHLLSRPDLLALLPRLIGGSLGCFCDPEDCHGHVIIGLLRDGLAR